MDSNQPRLDGSLGEADGAVRAGRRRFVKGGLASAPVLLSVVSRPVAAGNCSPASSFASVNTSRPRNSYTCAGRTPGYWKQGCKFWDWPVPRYIPSATPTTGCTGGDVNYTPPFGASATLFNNVFSAGGYPGQTLVQVLSLPGNTGGEALARHIVAALLNAAKGIVPADVLSETIVKNIWTSYVSRGYYEPTAGIRWYPDYSEPASQTGGLTAWLQSTMTV